MKRTVMAALCAVLVAASGGSAWAEAVRGPVTNLPLPRFVSLKTSEGNVRRGPSLSHRIDWVYTHRDLPLQVVNEYGHWRQVRDRDGQGGWIHYSLLSGVRSVMVEGERVALRTKPDERAAVVAEAERGVVARIDRCSRDWCRLKKGRHKGWAPKHVLWGVGRTEIVD